VHLEDQTHLVSRNPELKLSFTEPATSAGKANRILSNKA